jgi:ABC-type multidrug transport system ATPase subunit
VDSGSIAVSGRLSPFIELGVGFNPELSARDNVIINATMLGLSRREARARFDDIIAFAELEEFVDLKLKNYSSGMSVRLGFAVAVQVDAEVLLVDEVLAVGDASFQQKCFAQFEQMKEQGRTILYVTHDMSSVERFCDRGIVLERGRMIDAGPPDKITRTYSEVNFGSLGEHDAGAQGPVRILAAWCEDPAGERILSARQGERVTACMEVEFADAAENPAFRIVFRNQVRHTIFVCNTRGVETGQFPAGTRAVIRFAFDNRLAQSRYTLSPSVRVQAGERELEARGDDISALIVEADRMSGGVVDLPYELNIER